MKELINIDAIDLTKNPPIDEPYRQWYFIAKCREYVKNKSKELGRPLTMFTQTFGCPKVQVNMI